LILRIHITANQAQITIATIVSARFISGLLRLALGFLD
jgi:hypothetical protein